MPKSLQHQLQEAVSSGNQELAKALVEKMKVTEAKKKAKKPKKAKKTKILVATEEEVEQVSRKPRTSKVVDLTALDPLDDDENEIEEDDYTQPVLGKRRQSAGDTPCRTESFRPIKNRPNLFKDNFTVAKEDLKRNNKELVKLYGKIKHKTKESTEKTQVKVKCGDCGKKQTLILGTGGANDVYVASLIASIKDGGEFVCNECATNKG